MIKSIAVKGMLLVIFNIFLFDQVGALDILLDAVTNSKAKPSYAEL
jgi:hypothetical protein